MMSNKLVGIVKGQTTINGIGIKPMKTTPEYSPRNRATVPHRPIGKRKIPMKNIIHACFSPLESFGRSLNPMIISISPAREDALTETKLKISKTEEGII